MVATRRSRKRAVDDDSGDEQDDPRLDADFTAKDADTRDSEPESSDDDEEEPTNDAHWLYNTAKMHSAQKPPGKFACLLRGFFAKGPAGSFDRGYKRGKPLPKYVKNGLDEVEHPYQSCSKSNEWVLDAIDIAQEAKIFYPGLGAGFSMNAWSVLLADFAADQKDTSAGRRGAHVQRLLPHHARRRDHGHRQAQVVPRPSRIVDFISRLALPILQRPQNPPARRAHDHRVRALPGSLVRELHDFPVALEESKYSTLIHYLRIQHSCTSPLAC